MKQPIRHRLFWIASIIGMLMMSPVGANKFLSPVAAQQEPTPVATATAAPTWTPVSEVTATSTPTLIPGQTPSPTSTPTGRDVDLRPSDDSIEIDEAGECVLFSWLVKGDIDRIEWDKEDDDTDPILVSASDERTECVDEDSTFKLIARWSNGQRSEEEREIEIVHGSRTSSNGGGSSGGGGGPVPTPGAFVVVTPLFITNSLAFSPFTPTPEFGEALASSGPKPEGILGTIVELPETGSQYHVPHSKFPRIKPAISPYQETSGKAGMLLFGLCGLVLLANFYRQSN